MKVFCIVCLNNNRLFTRRGSRLCICVTDLPQAIFNEMIYLQDR